jgi:hypothetical protein
MFNSWANNASIVDKPRAFCLLACYNSLEHNIEVTATEVFVDSLGADKERPASSTTNLRQLSSTTI